MSPSIWLVHYDASYDKGVHNISAFSDAPPAYIAHDATQKKTKKDKKKETNKSRQADKTAIVKVMVRDGWRYHICL